MKINAYLLEREYCASAEHVTEEILEAFLALMLRLAHLGGLSWEEAALVDRTAAHFGCEQRIVAAAAAKAGDKSLWIFVPAPTEMPSRWPSLTASSARKRKRSSLRCQP